jgi:Ran GTPase-activating protein (RanGAP) involved in mRNA processing and transport
MADPRSFNSPDVDAVEEEFGAHPRRFPRVQVLLRAKEVNLSWKLQGQKSYIPPLATFLSRTSALLHLNLSNNDLDDGDAELLSVAMQENRTLVSLDFSDNFIREAGAGAIAAAIQPPGPSLEILDAGGNPFRNAGAAALAVALRRSTTLRELFLYRNDIQEEGAIAVASALMPLANTSLRRLHLHCNDIGNGGAFALSRSLRFNTTLTELFLDSNSIGDAGGRALASALETNKTLRCLSVSWNYIGADGGECFANVLQNHNSTLVKADVSENVFCANLRNWIDHLVAINAESADCPPEEVLERKTAEYLALENTWL